MKILIVGAAGHVGSIIRPALEGRHDCTFYDLRPVPERESRCIVADVNDQAAVERAVADAQCVVYLAMGVIPGTRNDVSDPNLAFLVNACGWFRFLRHGLQAGVRRFIYASSLSVYSSVFPPSGGILDESRPADSWDTYGLTKRVGEFVGEAAAQKHPEATIVLLRLMQPMNDKDWQEWQPWRAANPEKDSHWFPTAPNDTRRLFLAAVTLDRPALHTVQATGDVEARLYSHAKALEILDWRPEGS